MTKSNDVRKHLNVVQASQILSDFIRDGESDGSGNEECYWVDESGTCIAYGVFTSAEHSVHINEHTKYAQSNFRGTEADELRYLGTPSRFRPKPVCS